MPSRSRLSRAAALAVGGLALTPEALACPWCRPQVEQAVAASGIPETAALLALPLAVVVLVGAALHRIDRP